MEASSRKRLFPGDDKPANVQSKKRCTNTMYASEMTQHMSHFKLSGSPKRKNYTPKRKMADMLAATVGQPSGVISCKLINVIYMAVMYLLINSF